MKTKIRTFITVGVLAFAGANANATTNYFNLKNRVVTEEEKNVKSFKATENLAMLNGKVETIESEANTILDYQKEAAAIMKAIADLEEAKTIQILLNKSVENIETGNSDENEVNAEREEAQMVTKSVADTEETRAINKLISEGRL